MLKKSLQSPPHRKQVRCIGWLCVLLAGCLMSAVGCNSSASKSEGEAKKAESASNGDAETSSDAGKSENADAEGTRSPAATRNADPISGSRQASSGADATPGLDRSSPRSASYQAAKDMLTACFKTYKAANSYQDAGVLRLEIPYEQPLQEITPFRIAWERPNKLAIRTTQISSGWTTTTFESVAGNENDRPFDNQRLVRPLPELISLDWLMADHLEPVLQRRGIGFPLVLELIFAEQPLAEWMDSGNLSLGRVDTFDRVSCQLIEVEFQESKYVLWVDKERNLILRCELPFSMVQPFVATVPSGADLSKLHFSIDLVDAQVNQQIDWSEWKLPSSENDLCVRRFIEPPPRAVPPQLGTIPEHVTLRDVDGKEIFDSAQRRKPITVLQWIDTSNESRLFVDEVVKLRREIEARKLSAFVETLLVSSAPPEDMKRVLGEWNCDLPVAIEVDRELGARCGVVSLLTTVMLGKDGTIQWIDPFSHPDQLLESIESVHAGVDLASRLNKMVLDDEVRYASRLHRNIIDRDQIDKLAPIHREINPFPLSFHDLKMDWRCELENGTVAGSGETYPPFSSSAAIAGYTVFESDENRYRVASLLDDLGNVVTVDQKGEKKIVATLPIDQATNAKRIHVLPDPWTHQFIAIVPEGLPRFWYCVAPHVDGVDDPPSPWVATEATQLPLEANESVVTASWVHHGDKAILLITTDQGRMLELDPATQVLNRRSLPSASRLSLTNVVPQINERAETIGWNGVWSDKRVDPLPWLASDSGSPSPATSELLFLPEYGPWVWGRGQDRSYLVGIERFPSGETGAVLMDNSYQPLLRQALSVRPEQCKLLSATQSKDDRFYWLATAPNRVIHIQSVDAVPDQMSFGKRVFGATLLPVGHPNADDPPNPGSLKMIVIMDREVSCWTISPQPMPAH